MFLIIDYVVNNVFEAKVNGQPAFDGTSQQSTTGQKVKKAGDDCNSNNGYCINTTGSCAAGEQNVPSDCGAGKTCCLPTQ